MQWDKLTIAESGDSYERLWGHFLEDHFPEWERFWAHHVVPLTNRIDADCEIGPAKLFSREDPRIADGVEALMMANYSVFYYLARSCAIVAAEPHLFVEDAFIFLRATTENVARFMRWFKDRVARPLKIDPARVPSWIKIKETKTAQEILNYRDAFVHSGRLGQNPNLPREFIPSFAHLEEAAKSWRYIQTLPATEFVDSRMHLKELQIDLMKTLNPVWKTVTDLMDEQRSNPTYLELYRLQKDPAGKLRPIK
jgi:hypothetical protein